jgi:hypothetical protein
MATAGPLTFDAALLTVPTTPPLPVPFWLAVLRFEELWLVPRFEELWLVLRFEVDLRGAAFRAVVLRAVPLLERDAVERLAAADLDRDPPLLVFVVLLLGREDPLDALLLRAPLELALVAILSSPFENVRLVTKSLPSA